jgi:AraC family transcriptional regulator
LAHVAGLSKFHFIRAYTAQAGLTPMADVRAIRLDAARHLILTTDLPLKVIAPQVGLASEFHLSRLFTAHFGAGVRQLRLPGVRVASPAAKKPAGSSPAL